MTYRVVIAEPTSASGIATSSAIDKLEDALDFTREFVGVLRIEDATGAWGWVPARSTLGARRGRVFSG